MPHLEGSPGLADLVILGGERCRELAPGRGVQLVDLAGLPRGGERERESRGACLLADSTGPRSSTHVSVGLRGDLSLELQQPLKLQQRGRGGNNEQ